MPDASGLARVAPHLTHPLSQVGYVLFLFFGIQRALIKAGILLPISQRMGGKIAQLLLKYGFILAIP